MKKIFFSLLYSSLCIVAVSGYAQGLWTAIPSYPGMGRGNCFSFSIGGNGYVGAGQDSLAFILKKDFWAFNAATGTWTQKADFGGVARWKCLGFTINDFGYAGLGMDITSNYFKDLWQYDPTTNSWTRKADMPVATAVACAFVANSMGYVATGQVSAYTQNLFQYDPSTNSWIQKTSFPGSARSGAVAFALGNKGYVGTGVDNTTMQRDFYEYDAMADTWKRIADFAGGGRTGAVAFSIACKGYVTTGDSAQGISSQFYYKDLWQYDTTANTWSQMTDFQGDVRNSATCFVIGNKAYVGLGVYLNLYDDFYQYTTDSLCLITEIPETANNLLFTIAPNPGVSQFTVYSRWNQDIKGAFKVFNFIGEQVYSATINGKEATVNCNFWPDGIYFIKVASANGEAIAKIVIQK